MSQTIRNNMKRKSIKRKSMKRKSMKRKSIKRKSIKRKSIKRKSMKRSMNKNYYGGAEREEQLMANGCSNEYPYCVDYECSRLGKCLGKEPGRYCRKDQASDAWTGWQSGGPHNCKSTEEVKSFLNGVRDEIKKTEKLLNGYYTEVVETDGYKENLRLSDNLRVPHRSDHPRDHRLIYLGELLNKYYFNGRWHMNEGGSVNFNKLTEKEVDLRVNKSEAESWGGLGGTYKDFLTDYTLEEGAEEALPVRQFRDKCDMYKKILYIKVIYKYSKILGINIDDRMRINYDDLDSFIQNTPFEEIESLYNELNLEFKGMQREYHEMEDLIESKLSIMIQINDYIIKINARSSEEEEDLVTMENLYELSKEEVIDILENKKDLFDNLRTQLFSEESTTPGHSERVQIFKIG